MGRPANAPDLTTLRGRIGARIRKAREAKRWNQQQFAEALTARGLSTTNSAVSFWESGDRMPAVDDLYTVAATLGLSVRELLPPR
jgi:transcriptional regulator with XRE-family HTH domain